MSRLAVGTVQFGLAYGVANQRGQVSRSSAGSILKLAGASGINTIDTAIAYGESEACLGEIGTRGFKIVTKLPAIPDFCVDIDKWVEEQISMSLARLNVPSVHGLLLHRAGQLLEDAGQRLYLALQRLKNAGYVEKIGVSIYAPIELGALLPRYDFDLVQAPINLVDRRLNTSGWLQRLKAEGVEIHARSAFLQGLLLMPRGAIPEKFAPWSYLWDRWHDWLAIGNITAVQACLAYPLSFPEIDRVIVGADSVSQWEEILSSENCAIPKNGLPDLQCEVDDLINPARWSCL